MSLPLAFARMQKAWLCFSYTGNLGPAAYGHGTDCRKCTDSACNVSVAVEARLLEISVGAAISFAKRAASGDELTRHFGANCGSPLFTSSPRHPDLLYIKAGIFDDPSLVRPSYQSWVSSSVPWATIAPGAWKLSRKGKPSLGESMLWVTGQWRYFAESTPARACKICTKTVGQAPNRQAPVPCVRRTSAPL
jgi:hypothetical protein